MRMVVYQSVRKGRNSVDVALGVHVLSVCFSQKGWNSGKHENRCGTDMILGCP